MRFALLLCMLCLLMPVTASSQTSFVTDRAMQQVNVLGTPTPLTAAIPYASVRVCSLPLTQQSPCLPLATISDINGNTISNSIGSNFGQFFTDVTGRYTFGCTVNTNYQVQIAPSASNTPATNYPISCPGFGNNLGSNLTFSGNTSFTGAVTATGGFNVKNFENVRYVDAANSQGWAGTELGEWANAAATALGGCGTVHVASGSYTLTHNNAILLLSCVQFVGDGIGKTIINTSAFVSGEGAFSAGNSAVTDCYVGGFTVIGIGQAVDNRGISYSITGNLQRCIIENNRFQNMSEGIDAINASNDNIIRGNFIDTVGLTAGLGAGIHVQGDRNQIVNNNIKNVIAGGSGTHAVYLSEGIGNEIIGNVANNVLGFCYHNFTQTASGIINGSRIIGNYCNSGGQIGSGGGGGIAFAETAPATGNRQGIISGNVISNTKGNSIYASSVDHVEIADNTITSYQGDGIQVTAGSGFTTTGIEVHHNNIFTGTVSGNCIDQFNSGVAVVNITIDHNFCDGAFANGIVIQGCGDCIISGNRIKDHNLQGVGTNAGIQVTSSSLRTIVSSNNVSTVNQTGNPPGIWVRDAGSTDTIIMANVVLNNGSTPYFDSGTRTRLIGNVSQATNGSIETVTPLVGNSVHRQQQVISDQGSVCTNGELALSAGWQSTGSATVTAAAGNGQTCSWTITTGTTTAANPTITDTLTNALPNTTTVCWMTVNGGTHTPVVGAGTSDTFRQTTLSATAPIFTYQETPTAGGTTYFVTRGCGP